MKYSDYQHLLFEHKDNGILLMTINRPEVMNATNARLHWELTQIWRTIAVDDTVKVVIVTGAGKAFSAGGDLDWIAGNLGDMERLAAVQKEAADLVYQILDFEKPIISAINGVAVGAGLVVALMADISIMAENAKFTDGHVKIGVGAGDHAAILWPILCGMAKAKYYLMTADFVDGKEAERIGLVSLCAPLEQLLEKAFEVADKLASGSQPAICGTKQALNGWMQQARPIFENSLRMEMHCFMGEDAREGLASVKEKRPAKFPSAMK